MNTPRRLSPTPPDPAAVAMVAGWLKDFSAEEIQRHAARGTPAVRMAAQQVLNEMLPKGDDRD